MKTTKISNNEKVLHFSIISYSITLSIQLTLLIFLGYFKSGFTDSILIYSRIVVGFLFILSLPYVLKNISIKNLFIILFVFIIGLMSFLIHERTRVFFIEELVDLLLFSIPMFLYSLTVKSYKSFYETTYKLSNIIFLFGFVIVIGLILDLFESDVTYSAALSYYMLIPAILNFDKFFSQKKIKHAAISILSIFSMLSFGARGPLIGLSFYFIIYILKSKNLSALSRMISIFILLLIYLFFDNIGNFIFVNMQSIGINARSLKLLLQDNIHYSGRDQIYTLMINKILESPFIGYGLFGDRYLRGNYAHNIFLEIWSNFGILLGSVVIISLISLLIKSIFLEKDEVKFKLNLFIITIGFIPLLVSYSYLTFINFWIMLGVLISQINFRKETNYLKSSDKK